jgi:succinate dehydrogenase / fumarate reductase cytochrome b subunit
MSIPGDGGPCYIPFMDAKVMNAPVREASALDVGVRPAKTCDCSKARPFRRAHGLFALAFGAFLAVHLCVNASALQPARFVTYAAGLRAMATALPALEIVAIGLPLLGLLACGIYLLHVAGLHYPARGCNRGNKVRYFLQRTSALLILAFIAFHLATLSPWGLHSGTFEPSRPYASVAAALAGPAVRLFYLLAIVAVSYHVANGLFTSIATKSLTRSDEGKRRWGLVCATLGLILASLGSAAWYAFALGSSGT